MFPRLSFVVAHTVPDRVIGHQGVMPWHLPADLAHFRRITWGHPVLMGRRTQESIGRPLPGRTNLVISRNPDYAPEGVVVCSSLEEIWRQVPDASEIFVIGGGTVYEMLLTQATRLYLTWIHATVEGDTFFPPIDMSDWQEVSRQEHPADEKNLYALTFLTLDRISGLERGELPAHQTVL
ncbi:MAG: dihydrofolate reductase [Ferrovum sp.]|nr:dihydrofolate reductase [Ferrovum sp.]NDU86816.1 dihydrofolate reductase [Ferrovum sp.]